MNRPTTSSQAQPAQNSADSPSERRPRHQRDGSDLQREPDGTLRFRVRCACGWRSEPVPMAQTILVWEDHWTNRAR